MFSGRADLAHITDQDIADNPKLSNLINTVTVEGFSKGSVVLVEKFSFSASLLVPSEKEKIFKNPVRKSTDAYIIADTSKIGKFTLPLGAPVPDYSSLERAPGSVAWANVTRACAFEDSSGPTLPIFYVDAFGPSGPRMAALALSPPLFPTPTVSALTAHRRSDSASSRSGLELTSQWEISAAAASAMEPSTTVGQSERASEYVDLHKLPTRVFRKAFIKWFKDAKSSDNVLSDMQRELSATKKEFLHRIHGKSLEEARREVDEIIRGLYSKLSKSKTYKAKTYLPEKPLDARAVGYDPTCGPAGCFSKGFSEKLAHAMGGQVTNEFMMRGLRSHVHELLYDGLRALVADDALDEKIFRICVTNKRLCPEHMEIAIAEPQRIEHQPPWGEAPRVLARIGEFRSPIEKLGVVFKFGECIREAFFQAFGANADLNADVMIPLCIVAVIHAKPPHLVSEVAYIRAFGGSVVRQGQWGYYLTILESVPPFLEQLGTGGASELCIDDAAYRQMQKESFAEISEQESQAARDVLKMALRKLFSAAPSKRLGGALSPSAVRVSDLPAIIDDYRAAVDALLGAKELLEQLDWAF